MVTTDRTRLLAQMEGVRRCDDPDVRDAMRAGYGKLHLFVETVSGADEAAVASWFADGMLLNVVAAMDLWEQSRALGAPPARGGDRRRARSRPPPARSA